MELSFPEQRRQHERRTGTAILRTTLRSPGRRQETRQRKGQWSTYVDCLAPRVVLLVCVVLTCSALDALFTLLHIQLGGSEVNPLMALAINYGATPFVGLKMTLTGLGALVLAAHHRFQFGLKALYGIALVYTFLLLYHALNFLSHS